MCVRSVNYNIFQRIYDTISRTLNEKDWKRDIDDIVHSCNCANYGSTRWIKVDHVNSGNGLLSGTAGMFEM